MLNRRVRNVAEKKVKEREEDSERNRAGAGSFGSPLHQNTGVYTFTKAGDVAENFEDALGFARSQYCF
jgi:hypothetical protein